MSIIVIADTHGNYPAAIEAVEREAGATAIIHLGDCAADAEILQYGYSIPVVMVAGNCDTASDLSREVIMELEGIQVLLTHGHLYGVKKNLDKLISHAAKETCSLVLYGHTHRAAVSEHNGILFVNPGTLKQDSGTLSYARLDINNDTIDVCIIPIG